MRRLGGGYGFTKIDLADAYNQIKLSPRSQRRLALSTSKGSATTEEAAIWNKVSTRIFPADHGPANE